MPQSDHDKSRTIIVPGRKLDARQTAQARELKALAYLWSVLAAARRQSDDVTWFAGGGVEAEAVLEALQTGGHHPLLTAWEARKVANHPAPAAYELRARRLAVLLTIALHRCGLHKRAARIVAAQELADAFTPPPTAKSLEHWRVRGEPIGPADELVVATAIARCKLDPQALGQYFTGLVHLTRNPIVGVLEA